MLTPLPSKCRVSLYDGASAALRHVNPPFTACWVCPLLPSLPKQLGVTGSRQVKLNQTSGSFGNLLSSLLVFNLQMFSSFLLMFCCCCCSSSYYYSPCFSVQQKNMWKKNGMNWWISLMKIVCASKKDWQMKLLAKCNIWFLVCSVQWNFTLMMSLYLKFGVLSHCSSIMTVYEQWLKKLFWILLESTDFSAWQGGRGVWMYWCMCGCVCEPWYRNHKMLQLHITKKQQHWQQ